MFHIPPQGVPSIALHHPSYTWAGPSETSASSATLASKPRPQIIAISPRDE
jgi:hypothetical protein